MALGQRALARDPKIQSLVWAVEPIPTVMGFGRHIIHREAAHCAALGAPVGRRPRDVQDGLTRGGLHRRLVRPELRRRKPALSAGHVRLLPDGKAARPAQAGEITAI